MKPIIADDHPEAFAADPVRDGRYPSVNEAAPAGLAPPLDREARVKALRAAIEEGLASGPPVPFDPDAFRAELRRRREAEA